MSETRTYPGGLVIGPTTITYPDPEAIERHRQRKAACWERVAEATNDLRLACLDSLADWTRWIEPEAIGLEIEREVAFEQVDYGPDAVVYVHILSITTPTGRRYGQDEETLEYLKDATSEELYTLIRDDEQYEDQGHIELLFPPL